jgi:hypothetical protein
MIARRQMRGAYGETKKNRVERGCDAVRTVPSARYRGSSSFDSPLPIQPDTNADANAAADAKVAQ